MTGSDVAGQAAPETAAGTTRLVRTQGVTAPEGFRATGALDQVVDRGDRDEDSCVVVEGDCELCGVAADHRTGRGQLALRQ